MKLALSILLALFSLIVKTNDDAKLAINTCQEIQILDSLYLENPVLFSRGKVPIIMDSSIATVSNIRYIDLKYSYSKGVYPYLPLLKFANLVKGDIKDCIPYQWASLWEYFSTAILENCRKRKVIINNQVYTTTCYKKYLLIRIHGGLYNSLFQSSISCGENDLGNQVTTGEELDSEKFHLVLVQWRLN